MSAWSQCVSTLQSDPKNWLVTGVAGFIGSHLLENLLSMGQHVVGIDNFATGSQKNFDDVLRRVGENNAKRFRFIEGDICDPHCLASAMNGIHYVLHQAALGSVPRSIENPWATHEANVNGFLQVLLAARACRVQRIVYASSSSVYGDHPMLPKKEASIGAQLSPYAVSKYVDELYANNFSRVYGLSVVGLRYFNVFGPRQDPEGAYAAVIPRWTARLAHGEHCQIFGDGNTSRDFCFVKNVVQANCLAALAVTDMVTGRVFNVANGGRTTLKELYGKIRGEVALRKPEVANFEPEFGPQRAGDVAHSHADISAAREALGYEPEISLEVGLQETVAWFLQHRH